MEDHEPTIEERVPLTELPLDEPWYKKVNPARSTSWWIAFAASMAAACVVMAMLLAFGQVHQSNENAAEFRQAAEQLQVQLDDANQETKCRAASSAALDVARGHLDSVQADYDIAQNAWLQEISTTRDQTKVQRLLEAMNIASASELDAQREVDAATRDRNDSIESCLVDNSTTPTTQGESNG